MADNKQTQKAGDNSQQIQAGTVIINNGINESQARELYSEMSKKAMEEYTAESHLLIEKRIAYFENVLIPRIEKIENGFEAFADPEFQLELRKAQVSSACTDREADYEMLSELLIHRVENKDNRRVKASISKAIEIVNSIDDESLCGLTMLYAILLLYPIGGNIQETLEALNDLFHALNYHNMPKDNDWLSFLDTMNVIRITRVFPNVISRSTLNEYYFRQLNGFTECGIEIGSNEYNNALRILKEVDLNNSFLVPHELLENHVRIPIRQKGDYNGISVIRINPSSKERIIVPLSEKEKQALDNIWNLYSQDESKKREIKEKFDKLWNSFDDLIEIDKWWNTLNYSVEFTPIGEVLSHANGSKYYKDFPQYRNYN